MDSKNWTETIDNSREFFDVVNYSGRLQRGIAEIDGADTDLHHLLGDAYDTESVNQALTLLRQVSQDLANQIEARLA